MIRFLRPHTIHRCRIALGSHYSKASLPLSRSCALRHLSAAPLPPPPEEDGDDEPVDKVDVMGPSAAKVRRELSLDTLMPQMKQPITYKSHEKAKANKIDRGKSWRELKRMLALYLTEKRLMTGAMITLTGSTAITLALPAGIGYALDLVTVDNGIEYLPALIGGLSGLFAVGSVLSFSRNALLGIIGSRITVRLQKDTYNSLMDQEMAFHDRNKSGELVSRLANDTWVVGYVMSSQFANGLTQLAQILGSVGCMLYTSPSLTAIVLVTVPAVSVAAATYGSYIKQLSEDVQERYSIATALSQERLSNLFTVRLYTKEAEEKQSYGKACDNVLELATKEALLSGFFYGGVDFAAKMSMLGVLWYGGTQVSEGTLTLGALTSFLFYGLYMGSASAGLSEFYGELMKGVGASLRVFDIQEAAEKTRRERDDQRRLLQRGTKSIPPEIFKGQVLFKDVFFAYPTRPNAKILNGLTLSVSPGTSICLVGGSGSGKSTTLQLLAMLYDLPVDGSCGRIFLDGIELNQIDPMWLRTQIAYVGQQPVLFAGRIKDNIAYGKQGATDEEIMRAAVAANCHGFITKLPDGYNSVTGEKGATLSGGQMQRISIARALLRDPKILILDEATSQLDPENEYLVNDAINTLKENRTCLIISHRVSTIRSADIIAVLEHGKVAQLGTWDELCAEEGGVFDKLIRNHSEV